MTVPTFAAANTPSPNPKLSLANLRRSEARSHCRLMPRKRVRGPKLATEAKRSKRSKSIRENRRGALGLHSVSQIRVRSTGIVFLIGALLLANPALANWWIVRSSDGTCLVVDMEPTDQEKGITKIGKDSYKTEKQAQADAKRLCKESKANAKRNRSDRR